MMSGEPKDADDDDAVAAVASSNAPMRLDDLAANDRHQHQQEDPLQEPFESQGVNTAEGTRNEFIHYPDTPIPPSSEVQIDYYGLALVFLAPALGGFLYGYDIGATSFVLAMMRESRDHDDWWHGFPKWKQGLLVSTLALGALLGSHIVLVYLAKTIGRRKEIRIAAALYIIGAMLNVMSGTILGQSEPWKFGKNERDFGVGTGFVTLICGRLFYGAGVGFIMHGAPTYMAEMSPSTIRGALVSAKETVIVFGILVGMLMGDLLSDYPESWTDLYAFSILGSVTMLLLTFKIPRSKRWLLMKGYREEAKESMQFIYKGNIEDEFDRMAETLGNLCCRNDVSVDEVPDDISSTSLYSKDHRTRSGNKKKSGTKSAGTSETGTDGSAQQEENTDLLRMDSVYEMAVMEGVADDDSLSEATNDTNIYSRKYRHIMVVGLALLAAQQFSGQPSVLAYSRVLFEAAGWQGHVSVVTVLIMGITSSVTVALVDRVGRKALLLAGCCFMALALSALTYGFWGWDDEDDKSSLNPLQQQIVLWSMFVYIAGYQVGYGPVSWTLLSEIYPSEIRGTAMALSVEVNFLAKFLCQLFFPMVQDFLGWGCTFIAFIVIISVSFLFITLKVPETTGMSLEEIQIQLRGVPKRRRIGIVNISTSSDRSKPLLDEQDSPTFGAKHDSLSPIV